MGNCADAMGRLSGLNNVNGAFFLEANQMLYGFSTLY